MRAKHVRDIRTAHQLMAIYGWEKIEQAELLYAAS